MNFIALIGMMDKMKQIEDGLAKATIKIEKQSFDVDEFMSLVVFIKRDELRLPDGDEVREWTDKQKADWRKREYNKIVHCDNGGIIGIKAHFKEVDGRNCVYGQRVQIF